MIDTQAIRRRWEADGSKRDERGRRLFAASEARAAGWGVSLPSRTSPGWRGPTIERALNLDAPPLAGGKFAVKAAALDCRQQDRAKRRMGSRTPGDRNSGIGGVVERG